MKRVLTIMQGEEFRAAISQLPGYSASGMMTIHSLPSSAIETLTDEELKRLVAQRNAKRPWDGPGEEESTA